jgi:hypothetical protein
MQRRQTRSTLAADRAALLRAVLTADIPVHTFAPQEAALEQAFLQMTSTDQHMQELPHA